MTPPTQSFHEKSYQIHEEHYQQHTKDDYFVELAQSWLETNTVNTWIYQRLIKTIDPFITQFPEAKWLTVGDGRYGMEAQYLAKHDVDVMATDISDDLLKIAHQKKWIPKYQKENAEALSFEDQSYDFVLCKESYHHFPRPAIALYEMLRVARKAVILIEPNDQFSFSSLRTLAFSRFKDFIYGGLLKQPRAKHTYEEIGNYAYNLSRHEIEKLALGINLTQIAFKGINFGYVKGVELEQIQENGPLFKKVKRYLLRRDMLCKIGFSNYETLIAVIFKTPVEANFAETLKEHAFDLHNLPPNPYL